jgi:uncharacterized YccA/Bax inhibitor family protein
MQSSNPVFKRGYAAIENRGGTVVDQSTDELNDLYNAPAASSLRTGRMTIDDVVARTALLFAVLVGVGSAAWTLNLGGGALLIGFLGAMGLGLYLSFTQKVKPGLTIAYAALEGLALGTLSHMYEVQYNGIVGQALVATIAAIAGVLWAYKSKRIRVTPKFTRVMMAALLGYLVLGIGSFIGSFLGLGNGMGLYGLSGFGPLLAVGGVLLATFFLVLDFDQIEKMIASGAPQEQSWRAGFALMVTVVWLYLEVLRLISILRRD